MLEFMERYQVGKLDLWNRVVSQMMQ